MSQDQICAHERMLDVHDYCPDCGELRTSWLLEGAKLRARVAELEQELAAANGEPHADRCAQSRRLKVMCVERENLLLEAAAMMLAGAALMPDEMLFRWKGMRGMVERIDELSIQRAAIDAAMKGGA